MPLPQYRMNKPATLASLAQLLGLSRSTVSEILSGNERYAQETVLRVKELAKALNYEPNRSAQVTRRGRSNLIGVLHTSGTLQVVNERARYLGEAISETGYDVLVADWLWHTKSSLVTLVRHMIAARVEGIIFSDAATFKHADQATILDLVRRANIPAISISAPHQPDIPAINADFENGYYDLTRHLLETGRRRITLQLGQHPDANWHSILRYRGFVRAMTAAGAAIHDPLPLKAYRKRWRGKGIQGEILYTQTVLHSPYKVVQTEYTRLFREGFETDGIVAANDQWAAAIINTALRESRKIPDDFAVTGFDDSYLATLSPIPITSASQESEKTCHLAVKMLLEKMKGHHEPGRDILIPCSVSYRESSAPRS